MACTNTTFFFPSGQSEVACIQNFAYDTKKKKIVEVN